MMNLKKYKYKYRSPKLWTFDNESEHHLESLETLTAALLRPLLNRLPDFIGFINGIFLQYRYVVAMNKAVLSQDPRGPGPAIHDS
jgi:hypothetical protein